MTGDWQKFKGLPGTEGTLRTKEPKRDKQELFNEALKDAANEPKGEAVTKKKPPPRRCRGSGRGAAEDKRREGRRPRRRPRRLPPRPPRRLPPPRQAPAEETPADESPVTTETAADADAPTEKTEA